MVALAWALAVVPAAAAQTEHGALVVSAPQNGTTTGPDVTVVVALNGSAGGPVSFAVILDAAPALLEDPRTGRTSMAASVAPGARTTVILRGLPEGTHQLQAVSVPGGAAAASATTTFKVDMRGFSLVLLLATLGVLVVFVAYRRRILAPWADRYERRRDGGEPDEDG